MLSIVKSVVQRTMTEFRQYSPEIYGALFPYTPLNPDKTSVPKILSILGDLYKKSPAEMEKAWLDFEQFYTMNSYSSRFGESKTLNKEETFGFYCVLKFSPNPLPKNILEVGTQTGISTRKILDLLKYFGIQAPVTCFDIYDGVKHFAKSEATLRLEDITNKVDDILNEFSSPGIIFLDARPYYLIENIVKKVLSRKDWTLVIHDCSPHICNPNMKIEKDELNISSVTGTWERHVLANVTRVENPLSQKLDRFEFPDHSLRILPTAHGLAILIPKSNLATK